MNRSILKSILPALCLCYSTLFGSAQCPDSTELNITATLYTQENGLTSNMLIGTAKDSTGYLYFLGVDGKWLRFDGVGFRVISDISRIPFYNFSVETFGSRNYTLQYISNIIYKVESNKQKITRKWALKGDSLICFSANENRKEIIRLPQEIAGSPQIDFYPAGENCWLTTHNKVFLFNLQSKKSQNIPVNSSGEITLLLSEPLVPSRSGGSPYLLSHNALLKLNPAENAF